MKSFKDYITEKISVLKSYAEQSGKSVAEVEKLWEEIVASTKNAHPELTEKDDRFWEIVNGTVKKILKI
jgi:hypothetical protein